VPFLLYIEQGQHPKNFSHGFAAWTPPKSYALERPFYGWPLRARNNPTASFFNNLHRSHLSKGKILKIFTNQTYKGLELYSASKSSLGFYEPILKKLLEVFIAATKVQIEPTAIHFIIDSPIRSQLRRISEIVNRWHKSRDNFNRKSSEPPLYLYVTETHPRTKVQHAHLVVIIDGANFSDACSLRDRLTDVSQTRKVKLARRKITCLQPIVNSDTGEIYTDENHGIRRKGSTLFHRLNNEFEDAFKRFSYIAKRFSKGESSIWSSSRVQTRLSKSNAYLSDCENQSNVEQSSFDDITENNQPSLPIHSSQQWGALLLNHSAPIAQ
jgi:hypothetical protein